MEAAPVGRCRVWAAVLAAGLLFACAPQEMVAPPPSAPAPEAYRNFMNRSP